MKKLLFFLAVILMSVTAVTVLSSCGDDEPDVEIPDVPQINKIDYKTKILGTWYQYDVTRAGGEGYRLTFYKDGTYDHLTRIGGSQYNGTYTVSEDGDIEMYDGGSTWNANCGKITTLTDSRLIITDRFGYGTITYVREPGKTWKEADPDENLSTLLKHNTWATHTNTLVFTFYDKNKIIYIERGSKPLGSSGYPLLSADGTFSIRDKKITATFNDIFIPSGASSQFPDWNAGGSKTVVYTILSISDSELRLTDGKYTWVLDALM